MHCLQKLRNVEMVVRDSSIFLGDKILPQLGLSVLGDVGVEGVLFCFLGRRFFVRDRRFLLCFDGCF